MALDLWDHGFWDDVRALQISNEVCRVEPPSTNNPSRSTQRRTLPHPSTNDVTQAITRWLAFCRQFRLDPGTETNLASIAWDRAWAYTNKVLSPITPVFQIWFTNGAGFESFNGTIYRHFSKDAFFVGFWDRKPTPEWDSLRGRILKKWEDLARDFELLLVERVGIPRGAIEPFSPNGEIEPPRLGTEDMKRLAIEWRNWPNNPGRTVYIDETARAFEAEFDLETGELKSVSFHDPGLIRLLGEALAGTQQKELQLRKAQ